MVGGRLAAKLGGLALVVGLASSAAGQPTSLAGHSPPDNQRSDRSPPQQDSCANYVPRHDTSDTPADTRAYQQAAIYRSYGLYDRASGIEQGIQERQIRAAQLNAAERAAVCGPGR